MSTHTAERRPLGALGRIGVVVALHAGLLVVIANSFGIIPSLKPTETEGRFIDEPRPDEDPLPKTEPDLTQRNQVYVPEPAFPDVEPDTPPDTITGPPPETIIGPSTGSAVTEAVIVGVRPDTNHPLTQPPYPPQMIRQGNEGFVDLEVYVLPTGRVGDARVIKSTGFEPLDRSAMEEAKRKWRLLPATRDGVAYAQWHRLRVTFKLNDQQR